MTTEPEPAATETKAKPENTNTDMGNVLKHIQDLESSNTDLKKKLQELTDRNTKLSAKTREGMQSALDTLMKKWMDALETRDDKVKDEFKVGLDRLVKNSAEDNGVWQMMVSASALHERQEHDLEKLRTENQDLRSRVNGYFGDETSRVGEKRKPESEPEVQGREPAGNIWDEFAAELNSKNLF